VDHEISAQDFARADSRARARPADADLPSLDQIRMLVSAPPDMAPAKLVPYL
jgi:hypothetical protein